MFASAGRMLGEARRRFEEATRTRLAPRAPPGRVVYAVGDVHGRADLLDALIGQIDEDAAGRAATVVFVGDYVDRGRESRAVLDILTDARLKPLGAEFLKGNHEATLEEFLDNPFVGPRWVRMGGDATLRAYGVKPPFPGAAPERWEDARQAFEAKLPKRHKRFLSTLKLKVEIGDFAFVHAGVKPGVPLSRQSEHDLLWIRERFLNDHSRHEKVIVHGHSAATSLRRGLNRIGVDTCAYATGVLTALRLEGETASFLQARAV